jgi:hypothetical protein
MKGENVTINTSGEWWTGTEASDIQQYLLDFTADGYPVKEFRLAKCSCGSQSFFLDIDEEDAAKRTCIECGKEHLMCDSEEYWTGAESERCTCPCGSESMNVGVGFSLYPDDGEVKWLYVGCRCEECGVLGCYSDWKIGYAPSKHLFDRV